MQSNGIQIIAQKEFLIKMFTHKWVTVFINRLLFEKERKISILFENKILDHTCLVYLRGLEDNNNNKNEYLFSSILYFPQIYFHANNSYWKNDELNLDHFFFSQT